MRTPRTRSISTRPHFIEAASQLTLIRSLTLDPSDVAVWDALLSALVFQPSVEEAIYFAVSKLTRTVLKSSIHSCHLMAAAARLLVSQSDAAWTAVSPSVKLDFEAAMASLLQHLLNTIQVTRTPQQRRWMLCFLAARQGLTTYATAMLEYSEEELADFIIVAKA